MQIGYHILGTLQHIMIPISQHTVTVSFQNCRSLCIIARLQRMLTTIDLDHQLRLRAQKVDNITVDGYLPPEAETLDLSSAQTTPQMLFGFGHRSAQLSGAASVGVHPCWSCRWCGRFHPSPTLPFACGEREGVVPGRHYFWGVPEASRFTRAFETSRSLMTKT